MKYAEGVAWLTETAEVAAGRIVISQVMQGAKYKPTFRELHGLSTGTLDEAAEFLKDREKEPPIKWHQRR